MRHYYFAYGSNMDLEQMLDRCPSARPLGAARLEGHRLEFAGHSSSWGGAVATIRPCDGAEVWGVAYSLEGTDLDALDRFEGAPVVYHRAPLTVGVHAASGARYYRRAVLYKHRDPAPRSAPARAYIDTLLRGAARWGIDPCLIHAAKERAMQTIVPDPFSYFPTPVEGVKVFVYGSLKRGFGNHGVLGAAKYLGDDQIRGFRMYNLGAFPGIVHNPRWGDRILGELYEVDAAGLACLDRLEGHPTFYRRQPVVLASGGEAQVYVLASLDHIKGRALIPSGEWTQRHRTPTYASTDRVAAELREDYAWARRTNSVRLPLPPRDR